MKNNLKSECNACPFRKNSAKGWLGGVWTAKGLHFAVMNEIEYPCHKTMAGEEEDYSYCVGAIKYMNINAKRSRDPDLKKLQAEFRSHDTSNILSSTDFFDHHENADILQSDFLEKI